MTLIMKIGLAAETHDQLIEDSNLSNLLQSSKWAKIKSDWDSQLIGFFSGDQEKKLVASCLVLSRQLPLGFSMLYIPRGIAMDYQDRELVQEVLTGLKQYGKSRRALFIKFDPALGYDERLIRDLKLAGARYTGRTQDMHDTIQPRFNAVVYREDFSEKNLTKKTQQFLRKARNSYPEVVYGGEELLEEFSGLMKKTEDRKQVSLRGVSYYQKLLSTYNQGDQSYITLVRLNLLKIQEELDQKIQRLQDQESAAKNKKKQSSLSEEVRIGKKSLVEIEGLRAKHGDLVPVAGTLTLKPFQVAETLYAGTDTDFQKYNPSYLVWFETIQHAFKLGADSLNMGGIENNLSAQDGLLKFKSHFKPRIEEYVGEFDIPIYRSIYPLARIAYRLRKSGFN